MLRGFCGSFELCSESEKALDWAVNSASGLFTENPSLQGKLGNSVVLGEPELPVL